MLIEGQPLLIPTGVQRNENNAATFQPYDPLEVLGNTSPTSPTPSNVKECGVAGQVILAVLVYAVAVYVNPYLANLVQQGAMMATGHQEEFSWEQFAVATITAGITSYVSGGYGGVNVGQSAASQMTSNAAAQEIVGAAVNGAIGSAVSQGVSMALGIQEKFSWAAVAGAAAGAAAGEWAMPTAALKNIADKFGAESSQFASASFIRASASGVANAATRSLMNNGDFGDNMLAALPDVIGQTMGAIAGASRSGAAVEAQGDGDSNAEMVAAGWRMDSDGRRYQIGLPDDHHGYAAAAASERRSWLDQLRDGVGDFFGFDNGSFDIRNMGLNSANSAAVKGVTWPAEESESIFVLGDLKQRRREQAEARAQAATAWYAQYRAWSRVDVTTVPPRPPPDALRLYDNTINRVIGSLPPDVRPWAAVTVRSYELTFAPGLVAQREWNAFAAANPRTAARIGSGVQALGGGVEMATGVLMVGGGALTSEVGLGIPVAAGGVFFIGHGWDTWNTGWRGIFAGEMQETDFHHGLRGLGVSNEWATGIEIGATIGAGGTTAFGREALEQSAVQSFQAQSARAWAARGSAAEPLPPSPNLLGQAGELASGELTGLPKNTIRIPSASGARDFRIPDHLEPLGQRYAAETKNVNYQSLTSQILDDVAHVQRSGYPGRVEVYIDRRTVISAPLFREHLNPGSPIKLVVSDLNQGN